MRIAIFGSGGVGEYFGGRLALAGQDVTFIARGEHLRALRSTGLRVDSIKGDFTVSPVLASNDPAQVRNVDVIVLGVKAWQIGEAADAKRRRSIRAIGCRTGKRSRPRWFVQDRKLCCRAGAYSTCRLRALCRFR